MEKTISNEINKKLGFFSDSEEKSELAKAWDTWKKSRRGLFRNYKNWENFVFDETDLKVNENQLFLYWSCKGKEKGFFI